MDAYNSGFPARGSRFLRIAVAAPFFWIAAAACPGQPPAAQGGGPAGAPSGRPASYPWNKDLMIRESADGQTFGAESVFVEGAGVPSVARNERGALIAAFQWFPLDRTEDFDRVAVRMSEDGGASWGAAVPIEVTGLPAGFQRPFDPTVVAVPGKGWRMYFSSGLKGEGSPQTQPPAATWSAISGDGVRYEFEPGARFAVEGKPVIDCAVAYDGARWRYLAPIGRPDEGAYAGTSDDGLTFVRTADVPSSNSYNWTGNLAKFRERLLFYGHSPQGIWWSEASGAGQWSAPRSTGVMGGDPAVGVVPGKTMLIYVSNEQRRNVPDPRAAGRAAGMPPRNADNGRPVEAVARELGVTPDQFREAFKFVRPAPRGQQPTDEQRRANRKVLSEKLGVSPERLDAVMDKYRPEGRDGNGPPPPPPRRK